MRKRLATTTTALALAGAAIGAAPASAEFALVNPDVTFHDASGATTLESMQAGSHPFGWTTGFEMNTKIVDGKVVPDEEARDVLVDFPPGLIGDPFAVPRCADAEFIVRACPDTSALGTHRLTFGYGEPGDAFVSVYSLEPPPGKAVRLGFHVLDVLVTVDAGIRPLPGYNAYAQTTNIPQAAFYYATDAFTVWGNPVHSDHDEERGFCGNSDAADTCPVDLPEKPFFTLPRACEGPLSTIFRARSWPTPDVWDTDVAVTHDDAVPSSPMGMQGCPKLGFLPQISSQATNEHAESPSGLAFELKINDPGLLNPTGIARSDIKKTVVTLPEGVTINPSQAEGLQTCTPAQFSGETADSAPGAGCPEASKIGKVEVESPLLEGEILRGDAYVAQQDDPATTAPGAENPFDTLIALYLTVKSPKYGISVGLAGKVEPDPQTGQIVTTFGVENAANPAFRTLPQLPFSNFRLRLREGGRSPLVTPAKCGKFDTVAQFVPWANPQKPFVIGASFQITKGVGGGPCPPTAQPFEPGFEAGTANNNAASHSPFNMRLTRRDGDQDLTRFDATLPQGVLAKLAGVSKCSDAAIAQIKLKTGKQELANPSCPANSRIGSVWGGAGVGSQLTYVPGSVYLAGPFDGAPLSVVGVVPAVAGPFDVGVVATRQALVVNPRTGIVKADGARSEPIPHMLAGIPLRVRDIQVSVDRPEFTLNPTSCDAFATVADIWGGGANVFSTSDDSPVARSARFQAANCSRLGFKPRLTFKLNGGTKRGDHPALRAVLKPRPGDANLEDTVVRLPRSAFLDQGHIRTICTRVQFAADSCPPGAIYGRVRAFTPLLDDPLEGPAYLRSSDNLLPDLVFDLKGEVDVESSARIDSIKGGIRATFEGIPDAPLTKVVVNMRGGEKGLIVNSRNLCVKKSRANVRLGGHNGKVHNFTPLVRAQCGKRRKAS